MQSCVSEDILYQYLNDEIPSDEVKEIKQHIETCTSCQSALSEMNQITEILISRERPSINKRMLRTYHQDLAAQFKSPGPLKYCLAWIQKKSSNFTNIRIYTTRLAFGVALILIGIMMDRYLLRPGMNTNQLTHEQVQLISSLNESDLHILQSFFNDTDKFLESIVNTKSKSMLTGSGQFNIHAQQLMQKTYQMDRYRHASDQMLTDILNQIEMILIESSNLEENDIQTSLEEIRTMVIQARLLMEVKKYQTLFNQVASSAGA